MSEPQYWGSQIHFLLDSLGTLPGIVGGLLMIALFGASFTRRGRWLVLAMLMYVATLSFDVNHPYLNTLVAPLSQIRSVSQPLTVALLAFLIIPTIIHSGRRLRTPILAGAAVFFIFQEMLALRILMVGNTSRAIPTLFIYITIVAALALGLPRWLQSLDDVYSACRSIALASLLFVIGTLYQLARNPSAVIFGSRLYATTGNPQHAALIIAMSLPIVCFLLASRRENPGLRLIWGATAGALVLMLIWTGSRTGFLMSLIAVGLLFRMRIGRALGSGIVIAIVVLIGMQFFEDSMVNLARFIDTTNTRSKTWSLVWEEFKSHPIIGTMYETTPGVAENSYLSTAGRMGIVGLSVLMVSVGLVFASMRKMRRMAPFLSGLDEKLTLDMVSACLTSLLIGAAFEGFLLGTITWMVFTFYIQLGFLKFFLESDPRMISVAPGESQYDAPGFPLYGYEEAYAAPDYAME